MINQFFKDPKTILRMHEGPIGPHINIYAKFLYDQGYSRQSSCCQIRLIANFSRWLQQQDIKVKDIKKKTIAKYLKYRKQFVKIKRGDHFVLNRLLDILGEMGISDGKVLDKVKNEYQQEEDEYKNYLFNERNLTPATVINYLPIVHKFLFERFGNNPIRFNSLHARDITGFILRHASNHSNKRAQLMVTAIRGFLKYLLLQKKIITDLSACVPTVPCWQLSTIPKYLQPEQVQTILRYCNNRQAPVGIRNYAILLLLARLGLRACEVTAIELEDIEWETGHINIRGKGGGKVRFPLPQDVGEAIADYLKNGRPQCMSRHIFVRQYAPIRKIGNSTTISSIVRRAIEQTGIKSYYKGAHLFRHYVESDIMGSEV
jgi:site-specific recombinase XerD